MRPLEGVTVVSLEQAVAVPFATRQLADLGARVIKIERVESGDFARGYDTTVHGQSSHFVWCNRSKESLTLNLKADESKEVFEQLLEKADIFVQNLAPGAMERMGYSNARLQALFPHLIIANLSGYGSTGPYKNKKAYDLLVQCEAGLVSVTGTEEEPSKAGISIADIAAGMYIYTGILTALLMKKETGKGTVLEVSMLEALGEWMGYPMYYAGYGPAEPKRTGASHSTIYPYGPFNTGDGKKVFIGLQNEREWQTFCKSVIQLPELAGDDRFDSNYKRSDKREALKKIIEEAFDGLSRDDVIERLEEAKIANARMNTMKEFFHHPQLEERNRWRDVETPAGHVRALVPPVSIQGVEPVMGGIPALGSHTESILSELGLNKEAISSLKEKGAI